MTNKRPSNADRRLWKSSWWVVTLFLGLLAQNAAAHPFHVSFTEAEWNPATGLLEVALKIAPEDLESELRVYAGRRVVLEQRKAEPTIIRYINSHLVFGQAYSKANPTDTRRSSHRSFPIRWVGYEVSPTAAWLYFEVRIPAGSDDFSITNSLLSHAPHAVNTMVVRNGGIRTTLTFTSNRQRQIVKNFRRESRAPANGLSGSRTSSRPLRLLMAR